MTQDQLTFDLASWPSLEREDYIVGKTNQFAFKMIENWEAWPQRKCIVFGPKSSGKTHLANVWAKMSAAKVLRANDIQNPEDISDSNLAILNVDAMKGNHEQEEALFHAHNLALERGFSLLFCGETPPNLWGIKLPDLKSRVEGSPYVRIDEPDDDLLLKVLKKLFKDRQLTPTPQALEYIILRLERSYQAAQKFVEISDKISLSEKKPLTRGFAKEIIDKHMISSD